MQKMAFQSSQWGTHAAPEPLIWISGRRSASLPERHWLGGRSGRFAQCSDSEQWASMLKAAVPCASVLRSRRPPCHWPEFAGCRLPDAAGRRARFQGARSRRFLGAADAESQSAAKLPAQPPPSPYLSSPSPRMLGSEGVGKRRRRRLPIRRLPARGRGRPGAGLCSPRAVPCSARGCSIPSTPAAWHVPPRIFPAQVGGKPHDER